MFVLGVLRTTGLDKPDQRNPPNSSTLAVMSDEEVADVEEMSSDTDAADEEENFIVLIKCEDSTIRAIYQCGCAGSDEMKVVAEAFPNFYKQHDRIQVFAEPVNDPCDVIRVSL